MYQERKKKSRRMIADRRTRFELFSTLKIHKSFSLENSKHGLKLRIL